jgi:hypothetical protein
LVVGRKSRKDIDEPPIDLVSRIERVEARLSPAERQVAAAVQQDYEAATRRKGGRQPALRHALLPVRRLRLLR